MNKNTQKSNPTYLLTSETCIIIIIIVVAIIIIMNCDVTLKKLLCVCANVQCHSCEGQRTSLWNLVSLSTLTWALGIELRTGLCDKQFYLLRHLIGLCNVIS